jgi:hypothetical protein
MHAPRNPPALVWATISTGLVAFFWAGLEADALPPLFLVSAAAAALSAIWFGRWAGRRLPDHAAPRWLVWLALGLAAGAGTALWMAALMLFKDIRHGHPVPHYPFSMVLDVLGLWLHIALGGGALALGAYHLRMAWSGIRNA